MKQPSSVHQAVMPTEGAQGRSPAEESATDRHVENCLLALWRWGEVQPERVMPGLRGWGCSTQACFGGHLTTWPEFQAQGVTGHEGGFLPHMREGDRYCFAVAEILFGDDGPFEVRLPSEGEGTDHAIVVNRLEQRIAELTQ